MPELTAASSKFKMKHLALNYVPTITFTGNKYTPATSSVELPVTLSNPRDSAVFLTFSDIYYSEGKAEFSSSDVTVGPYDEVNELLGETEDKIRNAQEKVCWQKGHKVGLLLKLNRKNKDLKGKSFVKATIKVAEASLAGKTLSYAVLLQLSASAR
ncbi:uncharacterized protein LOC135120949 [Zophobas morio]|uniref:uncharacterized protein LOC135120949 n=1 Tax=Zophobas morio TaxID=2755281 RepID=UPI0030838214